MELRRSAARKRVEIVIASLLVLAYLAAPIALFPRICVPDKLAKAVSYRLVIEGQQTRLQTERTIKPPPSVIEGRIQANGRAEPIGQVSEEPRSWALRFWCEVNASDFAVGLFTLLLSIATYFLWRATEELAQRAAIQEIKMTKSIEESARAATAMEGVSFSMSQSVKTAIDTAERQLRAYVQVTKSAMQIAGIAQQMPITPAAIPVAVMIVENSGQTPAYNMQTFGNIDYVAWPINPLDLTAMNFNDPNLSKSVIGMREETRKLLIFPRALTATEHQGVLNGTHALVAHGIIRYDDAFAKSRHTSFRFFVGGPFGIQGVALGQHADGNEAT